MRLRKLLRHPNPTLATLPEKAIPLTCEMHWIFALLTIKKKKKKKRNALDFLLWSEVITEGAQLI